MRNCPGCWYDTMHCEMRYFHSTSVGVHLVTAYLERIAAAVGNIQDVIKRTLFYGKPIDTSRLLDQRAC